MKLITDERSSSWTRAFTSVLLPLALAACESSPTEHHDEEPEAHGVIIRLNGQDLVTVDDGAVTGSLTAEAGDETDNFDIVFTDHDGNAFTGDLSEFFADATIANTDIAIFHSTGDFRAHIEGLAAGVTTIVFHFMHPPGAGAHSNYDSPAITLTVS